MRLIRVWFKKMGMSRYVSHLDLMRAMTRSVRRANIPLWYTEGFNPHPYMTFALPLSLGMESLCDSMDLRIEGSSTNEDIASMLKDNLPPGIELIGVTDPVYDPKVIALGEFDIFFDCEEAASLAGKIEDMLKGESLVVQKLGKKGRHKVLKDINLLEHLKSYDIGVCGKRVKLTVVFPAGSVTNINPSLLSDEAVKRFNLSCNVSIVRKKLMLESSESFK